MSIIETWFIVLGLIHLVLLVISLVLFMPKKLFRTSRSEYNRLFSAHHLCLLIIIGVVLIHLIEVNILDPYATKLVGVDFSVNIQMIEDGVVYWFSQHWIPALVYFFVFMYIVVYPFTLWFSPLFFLLTNNKKAMKMLAYGLLIIYVIALPFYLFFPVTNVYTFNGGNSALNMVIPTVDQFFYTTTTTNNSFPSLHVAMTLLIAKSVSMTNNKRYTYFAYFCTVAVIISVIYLAIHWIADVVGGIILALSVCYLLKRYMKE